MSKSSPSTPELREAGPAYVASGLDLELPVAPDFNSRPPQLGPLAFLQWCEEMMELTPVNRDDPERRFAQKAGLEFIA